MLRQIYPSGDGGSEDAKQTKWIRSLQRHFAELAEQFSHFINEERVQTLTGEVHMARSGVYAGPILGAVWKYKEKGQTCFYWFTHTEKVIQKAQLFIYIYTCIMYTHMYINKKLSENKKVALYVKLIPPFLFSPISMF